MVAGIIQMLNGVHASSSTHKTHYRVWYWMLTAYEAYLRGCN